MTKHEIKVKVQTSETSLYKTFLKTMKKDLPVWIWCKEQELKNSKIKL